MYVYMPLLGSAPGIMRLTLFWRMSLTHGILVPPVEGRLVTIIRTPAQLYNRDWPSDEFGSSLAGGMSIKTWGLFVPKGDRKAGMFVTKDGCPLKVVPWFQGLGVHPSLSGPLMVPVEVTVSLKTSVAALVPT